MSYVAEVLAKLEEQYPTQPEFLQAVHEVYGSLEREVESNDEYKKAAILERLAVPERTAKFRVTWEDDDGKIHVNRGYRVLFHTLLGPGKGGLRFHPTVNESILNFLGFEQTFKNALTGLSLGAAKGGSDFNPRGRSDREIMRFCQAFMRSLWKYIGANVDVPAGDIGVGAREVGYLFGEYRRLANWEGSMTGKAPAWGGSLLRPEATGYGTVLFAEHMLRDVDRSLEGARVTISGAGNVAIYAADLLIKRGATVLSLSDSRGSIYVKDGLTAEMLRKVEKIKVQRGEGLEVASDHFNCEYSAGTRPWSIPCDVALPCATQNELDGNDARKLADNGVIAVAEGANMPTTIEGINVFLENKVLYGPGKAANAGGVAVSGLEMTQNSAFSSWPAERVFEQLEKIMSTIYNDCRQIAVEFDRPYDLQVGANIAGFRRVARAMMDQGIG